MGNYILVLESLETSLIGRQLAYEGPGKTRIWRAQENHQSPLASRKIVENREHVCHHRQCIKYYTWKYERIPTVK